MQGSIETNINYVNVEISSVRSSAGMEDTTDRMFELTFALNQLKGSLQLVVQKVEDTLVEIKRVTKT
jgi:hypothetical protein